MKTISQLKALPADPLLGLMVQFRADERENKVDLGVGVYRDDSGETPILKAVRLAEETRISFDQTKVYEGPRGNPEFCEDLKSLVFGDKSRTLRPRAVSMATPGGCGALFLAMQLAKRASETATVWISNPSWANHTHMAARAGLKVEAYGYRDAKTGALDFGSMIGDLGRARRGDLVLIQGPCHNPSGIDLDLEQWGVLARLLNKTGSLPLIDIAYHGLGEGLDDDLSAIRAVFFGLTDALVSYSCSKNFGLYRERTGGLIALAASERDATAIGTHLDDISRAAYSMPPSHGAALVSTILRNQELKDVWCDELEAMRARIQRLRNKFSSALVDAFQDDAFARIKHERGMFSLMQVTEKQVDRLAQNYGIYVPGSGRINIAGLSEGSIHEVATAIRSTSVD